MCGICGIVTQRPTMEIQESRVRGMINVLRHRGPDEIGVYVSSCVGLGVARLKVIDLETGSQPVFNEDKTVIVVFNGEIINFIELHQQLQLQGHRFYTKTDTEVIVHLYESYGTDCLKYLNGMFAFALWDQKNHVLMLARDHLGIKPLYYFYDENNLKFASEMSALLEDKTLDRSIDIEALEDYLTLMFIPAPRTIFEKVKKIQAGHYLIWKDGVLKDYAYWKLERPVCVDHGERFYLDRLDSLLKEATRRWLRSDVPLGLFLSGGMDSTLLANYIMQEAKKLETFTAVFDQKGYDEYAIARETSKKLGTNHHEIKISEITPETIRQITEHFDEPFADFSSIPFYMLSRESCKYITVAITGDGGDEVFAGYPTYIATQLVPYYKSLPKFIKKRFLPFLVNHLPVSRSPVGIDYMAKRFLSCAELNWPLGHLFWQGAFSFSDYPYLFKRDVWLHLAQRPLYKDFEVFFKDTEQWPLTERLLYADQKILLAEDYLVKADRMSMAHGLEVRPILLDRHIVEFMHTVPEHYKLRGWKTKWILRLLYKQKMPHQRFNLVKRGFSPPMSLWLRSKLKLLCENLLLGGALDETNIFNRNYIQQLWEEHQAGKQNHARKLWTLASFLIWRGKYG